MQYGTKQEVERRRATENGLVKETTDTITALMLPKKIDSWNFQYPKEEMATIVNASGTLSNERIKVEKVLSLPAMTITGGAKPVIVASNLVKMDSQDSGKEKERSPKSEESNSNNYENNRRGINEELHEKINSRGKEEFVNRQADKRVGVTTTDYNNFEHISEGEVVVKGDKVRVTGGHKAGNKVRVIEKLEEYPGGSYEARVEIRDPNNPGKYLAKSNNGGKSTMFPNHWTENRIKVEIDNVLKNTNNKIDDNVWVGKSSSGVKIRVILDNNGKVITAYPIKP